VIPTFLKPYHTDFSNLIRLGRKSDGGYVIDKRVINKTKTIITCGLEAEWSFEKQFQKYNKNCQILAFDHTVDRKFWTKRFLRDFISLLLLKQVKLIKIIDLFKFFQYLIFFRGKNKHYHKKIVSKKTNKNNQVTITDAIGDNKDIVLKIDIEGDEYKVLDEVNKNFRKLNLVILEFHDLQNNLKKIKNFIDKTKFKNIHINANNYGMVDKRGIPQVIEMTFINPEKFKIKKYKTRRNYPIKDLDFKNRKRGPNIKIIFDK
tara:strand:- start:893 stop:1675 length:783 start_codon:yes stop_codon:yes gene_type:complete